MKNKKIFVLFLITAIFVLLLYPKHVGNMYGGDLPPVGTTYREERECLGFRYTIMGGPIKEEQILDGTDSIYCVGLPLVKKCYQLEYSSYLFNPDDEHEVDCK